MPATLERHADHALIRLEGECTLASAAELKTLLLDGLASGGDLRLDLQGVEEIDITTMQLLWAATREADRVGSGFAIRVSEAAGIAALVAGFETFPGAHAGL
ncbi:MAG: STAS domain-containing protein [Bryobacteraceae bacterium]|jgi:anti-anti-sigma regulatory factor